MGQMPTTEADVTISGSIGDELYDHLEVGIKHIESAQHHVITGDRDQLKRWIDEATIDLEAASAALERLACRELRRAADVTEELMGRDI